MITGVEPYTTIVRSLVKKSFPELKNSKIVISEKDAKYRAHVKYSISGMKIIVAKKIRNFPFRAKKRIMIHELCHLSIFKKLGYVRTNLEYVRYRMDKKFQKRVEKEAIILMIKKGYADYVRDALLDNKKRGLEYALSEDEFKYWSKKFKK